MSDLIKRETVLAFVRRCKDRLQGKGLTYEILVDYIEAIPSAERKGEWVGDCAFVDEFGQPYVVDRCNQCGYCGYADMNYCPNCGARMKGAEDE